MSIRIRARIMEGERPKDLLGKLEGGYRGRSASDSQMEPERRGRSSTHNPDPTTLLQYRCGPEYLVILKLRLEDHSLQLLSTELKH